MTAENNKLVMRRFLEFINTASEKLAQELISPDAIFHVPGRPEPLRGPVGYLTIIGMMRGAFPEYADAYSGSHCVALRKYSAALSNSTGVNLAQ